MILSLETRAGLRPLIAPVYVPSLVYGAGASALLPAQVLLALQMGFTAAGVAALMTWIGAFAIASSMLAGLLVDRFGERACLCLVTGIGVLGLVVAAVCSAAAAPGARWVLIGALTVFDLVDAVWSIARQGLVADLAPTAMRGRAMNLYGACQRLGRIGGPLIAAAVLAATGPAAVLPIAALIVLGALFLLLRVAPASARAVAAPEPRSPAAPVAVANAVPESRPLDAPRVPARLWRHRMALLGTGVLILSALRSANETLVPLWAASGAGLVGTEVALVLALASSAQLLLFWPAGLALDRWGRSPVVVTAMGLMGIGLCLAPTSRGAIWLLARAMIIGLGDGTGAGIIKTLGADLAPRSRRSTFLGRWQAIASAGSLLAPAVGAAAIAMTSLQTALVLNGAIGLAGAAWMAWWTPKLLPRPGRADRAAAP